MKTILLTCMIFLAAFASPSFAQGNSGTNDNSPNAQATDGGGARGGEREAGATGWNGGSRGQTAKTGDGPSRSDPESAANQPFMATGVGLDGQPQQFSAQKTPE